jgi:hypothetical protein
MLSSFGHIPPMFLLDRLQQKPISTLKTIWPTRKKHSCRLHLLTGASKKEYIIMAGFGRVAGYCRVIVESDKHDVVGFLFLTPYES